MLMGGVKILLSRTSRNEGLHEDVSTAIELASAEKFRKVCLATDLFTEEFVHTRPPLGELLSRPFAMVASLELFREWAQLLCFLTSKSGLFLLTASTCTHSRAVIFRGEC